MPFIPIGFDEHGVIAFIKDGKKIYNPFEIAIQSMVGKNVLLPYEHSDGNLIPRYYPISYLPDPSKDTSAALAMNWIEANEERRINSGFWNYQYDIEYDSKMIHSPWRSSFAQANIALASLLWFKYTRLEKYKYLALRAIHGLILPIEQGGTSLDLDGGIWYEEIPAAPTHIFNAQLISILAMAEANQILETDEFQIWIDKGLAALYSKWVMMDTGNWSAYDIPNYLTFMLQLLPKDPAKSIKLKTVILTNGTENTNTIELSTDDCYIIKDQWIAGIDWGNPDEEGYREIKYGPGLHPIPVPTGERQNSYIYFENVKIRGQIVELSIHYKTEHETELLLFRYNFKGEMVPLGFVPAIPIFKGEHWSTVRIPVSALGSALSEVYHKYHILLLEELQRSLPNTKIGRVISKYRIYLSNWKSSNFSGIKPVNLSSMYVSLNSECGLSCKMCDIGQKNTQASIYKNLHPSNKSELDPDLLIRRCREARDSLQTVHFIGTEPTLYTKLPYLVAELKKLQLNVIVTTNGINLERMLPDLLGAGLDQLWISIDGPAEIHDNIRGKQGLFENIMKALNSNRALILNHKQKHEFSLNVSCAVTPLNYMDLEGLIKETGMEPIDTYWFTHMNYVTENIAREHTMVFTEYPIGPSCLHEEMDPKRINPYEMLLSVIRIKTLGEEIGRKVIMVPRMVDYMDYEDFYKRPLSTIGKTTCDVPLSSMEVNCDGSICVMSRCYQIDIGNIKDNNLHDLFYSNALIGFRKDMSDHGIWQPCKRCCGIME
ncbi:D-glucuronyl C5-epimerase family protein [Desulfosporosinus fructosivorans]